VSWSHGTVGIADPCAPSWNGRQSQDEDYLNAYLSAGYAVVASDYQGLGTAGTHPYLATRPAAFSNLDLIRAAQQAGLPISAKVLMLGQSQGASAAIATAGLAAEYAPTVEVVGVIATGSPYFTPAAMAALSRLKQPDAPDPRLGYTFLAMTLAEQLETDFIRQDYITDEAWPIAEMVNTLCYHDLRQQVQDAGLTRRQSFQRDPMQGLQTAFVAMGYPRLLLPVPVFMGIGGEDRDTPPKMQLQLARSLCKAGTRVTVHQYPDLDHRQVVPGSVADSMTFARALFYGHTPEDSCDAILD
jgi:pimeloyl-ACP methyl ester carboxylesterase